MIREHIIQQAFAQGKDDGYLRGKFGCPFWWESRRKQAYIEGYELGTKKRAWKNKHRNKIV